jgi:two-component system KDP operon response regulator KdpE
MQQKKALVVDSNAGNRELVRILLEHEGYETIEARDSREALELASSTSPDLIMIDLQMPRHEGYSTALKLRQGGRFKKLMVALTGRELDSDPIQITAAGFTAYIPKPLVRQRLHDRLSQLQF